jgi:hypothetical protein
MASAYPASIVTTFTNHQNNVDIIDASHPNNLQYEVLAIETTVGITPNLTGRFGRNTQNTAFLPVSSAGSNSPDVTTSIYTAFSTFGTVADRITNVEGLANLAYSTASGITAVSVIAATATTNIDNLYKINLMGGF